MNPFVWIKPTSIADAASAMSALVAETMTAANAGGGDAGIAVAKAGGIDILDLMKENLLAPGRVVSLRDIPGLDAIDVTVEGGVRIGAMATLATLADHPVVRQRYTALSDAASSSASPQIRNVATVAGNLLQRPRCWYFRAAEFRCVRKGGGHCFALSGDNRYHAVFGNRTCAIVHPSTSATALVVFDAKLVIADETGATRQVPIDEFFVSTDQDLQRENALKSHEIVAAIDLPPVSAGTRTVHLKQGEKDSFDWPLVDVAVRLDLSADGTCTSAKVVLGAVAPVPLHAAAAGTALLGRRIDEAAARAAASAALNGATPLSHNAYKLPIMETLVRRAILKAASVT